MLTGFDRDKIHGLPSRELSDKPRQAKHTQHCVEKRRFRDIAHLMRDGDGLWFSGVAAHSYIIRIATVSNISHGGMVGKDGDGHIRMLEVVEFHGGQDHFLADEVEKYPGQYFWAPAQYNRFPEYDGVAAAATMWKFVNHPYGTWNVLREGCFHAPLIRELAYLAYKDELDNENAFHDKVPYCSMAQSIAATDGGVDPVPGRAAWLTAPQDTYQSLLWAPGKFQLYHEL